MPDIPLRTIAEYCDRLLRKDQFQDYDGASNGLQVENRGRVSRLAAAVDGSLATIQMAVNAKADLLIVHHGLFWNASHPWPGKRYEMLRLLLDNNLAVYSSHLPLDAHPQLGNNARLCAALGFRHTKPFFFDRGQYLGLRTNTKISRDDLRSRLATAVAGRVSLIPGGPAWCRH